MCEIFHCPEYLKQHPLMSTYPSSLTLLSDRDYGCGSYFCDCEIPSIDLDSYEKDLSGVNDCTSDGVIGIADIVEGNTQNKRLLLTELRMGYENRENIRFSGIVDKYTHSCDILRHEDCNCRIDPGFALIFKPEMVAKAKSRIFSWSRESSKKVAKNWIVFSPESFCNHINYGKSLPLTPEERTVILVSKWKDTKIFESFEKFNDFIEEIRKYFYELIGKRLTTDIEYVKDSLIVLFKSMTFPQGEDGDLSEYLLKEFKNEFLN